MENGYLDASEEIMKEQIGVQPSWMQIEDSEQEVAPGDFVMQTVQMIHKVR